MPKPLGLALADLPGWFVIGGQAMRCLCPYRPSRDVDLGVTSARDMKGLVRRLQDRGRVAITERAKDTVHLRYEGIDVSVFVPEHLEPFGGRAPGRGTGRLDDGQGVLPDPRGAPARPAVPRPEDPEARGRRRRRLNRRPACADHARVVPWCPPRPSAVALLFMENSSL